MINSLRIHAQGVQLACSWVSLHENGLLAYDRYHALLYSATGDTLQIVKINTLTCTDTLLYQMVLPSVVSTPMPRISVKNDSVLAVIQTLSGFTAIQHNPSGTTIRTYAYPTSVSTLVSRYSTTAIGISFFVGISTNIGILAPTIGSVSYADSIRVINLPYSPTDLLLSDMNHLKFLSDDTYHYVCMAKQSSVMIGRINRSLPIITNDVVLDSTVTCAMTDVYQTDTSVGIFAINAQMDTIIRYRLHKTAGIHQKHAMPYSVQSSWYDNVAQYVDFETLLAKNTICVYDSAFSVTHDVTFASDYDISSAKRMSPYVIWSGTSWDSLNNVCGERLKVVLLSSQLMGLDSLIIQNANTQFAESSYVNDDYYVMTGASTHDDNGVVWNASIWFVKVYGMALPLDTADDDDHNVSDHDEGIMIYPNPADDMVHITSGKPYIMYDMLGQIVQRQTRYVKNAYRDIDVSALAPGMYIISLHGEQKGFPLRIE